MGKLPHPNQQKDLKMSFNTVTTPRNGLIVNARPSTPDYAELVDSVLEIAIDLRDANGDTTENAIRQAVRQINDEYQSYIYADAIKAIKFRMSVI